MQLLFLYLPTSVIRLKAKIRTKNSSVIVCGSHVLTDIISEIKYISL